MSETQSKTQSKTTSKGLLDILMMLEDGERSFAQLKALDLSPNTILSRLREAQEMGLVDQKLFRVKAKRPRIKYVLTEEGSEMLRMYESIRERYVELKTELQSLQEEVKKKEKELKYLLSLATEKIH